ncbi:MAG: DUF3108 domain-containing protein [Candidatus Kapabacteria bacterium]|nr:DUF3108 domain-containing protein [Candidatus Kapabacteria bacterium]
MWHNPCLASAISDPGCPCFPTVMLCPFHHSLRCMVMTATAMTAMMCMDETHVMSAQALRSIENTAFGFGERLEYDVGYMGITGGKASFTIGTEPVELNGHTCYDVRFDVASLESLDFLYRVRDRYRTLIDVAGIYPLKFEQRIREGNYRRDYTATFDQVANKAMTTEGTFDIPPYVHDIVSAFFYVRTFDLKRYRKGQSILLQNFFGKKVHDLEVKVLGRQRVTVAAGTFDCVAIEPMVKEGGLFKSEGRIVIWLSDDDRKIPVKVSTKVLIGSIDAELTGYRGLRGPLASRIPTKD